MAATDPIGLVGMTLLDRYTIVERLGGGGMSVVYVADDRRLLRRVSVKVFFGIEKADEAYQTIYEHFVQEAFALSQLTHPNTLRIYDFGYLPFEPFSPFHVAELVEGGTLKALIKKGGAMKRADVLRLLEPIVDALGEAHARGIVHRDLKPSNILIGQAGPNRVVKLADFGIAKAMPSHPALPHKAGETSAGAQPVQLYSPGWAAPEQLEGAPVGPTADVYALALVTTFMLAGRKLFSGDEPIEVVFARMDEEDDDHMARRLAALGLPDEEVEVLARACRARPEDRYPSVSAFLEALRKAFARTELVRPAPRADEEEPRTDPLRKRKAAEAPPAPPPVLALQPRGAGELVVAGRRVRLLPLGNKVDLGDRARVRVTVVPDGEGALRLNLRGLDCFVARAGGRPSRAQELASDGEVTLLSADRRVLDRVSCAFASARDDALYLSIAGTPVSLPSSEAGGAALLDFGAGRPIYLLYRAATRILRSGRAS
jgi:serine/threonine-protein kinase